MGKNVEYVLFRLSTSYYYNTNHLIITQEEVFEAENDEDEDEGPVGTFKTATSEELSSRRMVKVKRLVSYSLSNKQSNVILYNQT